jgi:hypothetical protein
MLQRHAQVVGQRRGRGQVVAAEHPEGEPADRPGHAPAVVLQLGEGGVADAADVGRAAVDELAERLDRNRESPGGVGQSEQHQVVVWCCASRQRPDPAPDVVEGGKLDRRRQRAVADVVDAARERVDRRQGPPLVRRQQRDPVGEVLGLLPGDALAVLIGGPDPGRLELGCGHPLTWPARGW